MTHKDEASTTDGRLAIMGLVLNQGFNNRWAISAKLEGFSDRWAIRCRFGKQNLQGCSREQIEKK
jgi:hypothetical protein